MTFFQTYKNYIISLIIDLFLAIILVSIFRSSYSQDSFISDVVLYFIVIAVITIILGIKNGLVSYLLLLFVGEDEINLIVKGLIEYNLPKPTDWYDIDNPEDYFSDVVNNESESTKARMYAMADLQILQPNPKGQHQLLLCISLIPILIIGLFEREYSLYSTDLGRPKLDSTSV
jgi:hypothetical protein